MPSPAREAMAVLGALGVYRGGIVPLVRREVGRWREVAATIPDPVLRDQALAALREKALNVEATAVFATLAPRRARASAVRAMVALQVAIDYLDTLGEQPVAAALRNGLRLHEALVAALTPGAEPGDWYRFHPQQEDGGYLAALVAACQETVASLPSHRIVLPLARHAADRCGQGQSYTHADGDPLEAWASQLDGPPVYRWWEVAAGASSSVGAHALIAAAADPRTSAAEAESIDAAYFPSVGALTVLLDDLIDRDEDAVADAHNYMAYYPSVEEAASRLDLIAHLARSRLAELRQPHRHAAILAGVVGFYLGEVTAADPYGRPVRERLLRSAGPAVRPIVAFMRLRR